MPNGIQSLLEPIFGPGATPESILGGYEGGGEFIDRLQSLFSLAGGALGEIGPARAQEETFARTGGLQNLISLGQGFRGAQARSGFAGAGAPEQLLARGRRETSREFQQNIFGIGQRATAARSGIQSSLVSGIMGILNLLTPRGADLGGGDVGLGFGGGGGGFGGGGGGATLLGDAYEQYRQSGGRWSRDQWNAAGQPASAEVSGEPGAYAGGDDIRGYYEDRYRDRLT